jgi:hypothetical protein
VFGGGSVATKSLWIVAIELAVILLLIPSKLAISAGLAPNNIEQWVPISFRSKNAKDTACHWKYFVYHTPTLRLLLKGLEAFNSYSFHTIIEING